MKEKKSANKTRSIAWRIQGTWLSRLFWSFVLSDVVVLLLVLGENQKRLFPLDLSQLPEVVRYFYPLLALQGGIWLLGLFFGVGKIRRELKSLEQIGQTAQRLTQSHWEEEKFLHLEEAIGRISPVRSDAKIHLEDEELQGLETAVNNLLERMRESYRQQARFVSDASHELRTPISVIQGYANLLDRWGKEDETVLEEGIEAIKSEAEHMKKLVEQLLFLARGDSGHTPLLRQQFSIGAMLSEVLEESKMIDPDHKWKLSLPKTEVLYQGDEGLLKQSVRILVDNARKFSDSGESIMLAGGIRADGTITLSVQDEGMGIAPEDLPYVFERFYRADPARGRQSGGTGLGLAIAKWIVDRHGGRFEILSRSGLGTRITICLPSQKTHE